MSPDAERHAHALAWFSLCDAGATDREACDVSTDDFPSFIAWVEEWAKRALEIHRQRRMSAK